MPISSFAYEVKKNIISRKLSKYEKSDLLNGIISTARIEKNTAYIIINNLEIFDYLKGLLIQMKVKYKNPRKNAFLIDLNSFRHHNFKKERDYFSGVFLATGSINRPSSVQNHLELKFYESSYAYEALEILNKYNMHFKIYLRKERYLIYIKKIEDICDFLKAIDAQEAYYHLEDSKIERDFFNNANRITNSDIYNQQRIANANMGFLHNYDFIKKNHLEGHFNKDEILFFDIKEQNIDLSLNDLVHRIKQFGITKSRSALNHSLIKLRKLVDKLETK
ncbi:DNA-binding protein WhiA [[Mycoplasma] phocae]|uniref:DNA-binding protein WhiA n=1 Tax=[Mycoplasma] phocae TaxID=142651 RepID=A0A2Z5IQU2_9BACT|nr:DNA-binding protein WhiA [[Mycoplasma] phocae]AXE60947.1 DNA-binding protein WhiA [[Mycoplasma] phocae]